MATDDTVTESSFEKPLPPPEYVEVPLTSRRKDQTWNHCKILRKDSHTVLWCVYCGQTYKGMPINKMKQHIAGVGDNVTACRVPSKALKSVYFKPMINEICEHGPAAVFNELSGDIMKHVVEDLKEEAENCIRRCGKNEISLLVEENLENGKVFLHFSLYFVDGVKHYRTIDGKSATKSLEHMFTIFEEVTTSIGEEKILQVVCKNAGIYVDVGVKLEVEFPTVFWTPCAAHVAKLIIKDFERIQWIRDTCDKAKFLLNFILKNDTGINIDGVSRDEIGFLAVKELKKLEGCLKSLVSTVKWVDSELSKSKEGQDAYDRIVDDTFWKNCDSITVLMNLVTKLLMVVSGIKEPGLGYALAWMHKTKMEIKNLFDNQQLGDGDYKDFWKIIDKRWGYLQKHRLHIRDSDKAEVCIL
ncbi:uncharacterized protein LOC143558696 [Bidens hawaiensis]|uniref:uncharacterized protein LOC143558696 n=1 Tax=Bidens hawaiensis TaxID=980011 RepID=UPI00404B0F02